MMRGIGGGRRLVQDGRDRGDRNPRLSNLSLVKDDRVATIILGEM